MPENQSLPDQDKPTVPPFKLWQCPECEQLHDEPGGECMYECDADMIEVEVIAKPRAVDEKEANRG